MSNYHNELIQVAAVALAMVQDDMCGTTKLDDDWIQIQPYGDQFLHRLLGKVETERRRQESKWGAQHHSRETWLTILMEEVGEVARATLENT